MGNNVVESKPLSLKTNSLWNVLGSIVYALTQWGILIVIAKLGNPEMVGIFTLGLALTAPVVLLMRFNLRAAVASDFNDDFQFNEYFSSRIIATGIFLVIMIGISMFYSSSLEVTLVIITLSLAKAIESISDVLHGQMQKHERLDITAKSRILKGVLSLVLFTVILYLTNSLIFASIGFMLTWLFILIIYDFEQAKLFGKISFTFNKSQQLLLFKMTLPLGIAQLTASLNANIPRYFIEHFHGIAALGFFAAIIYIVTAGNNVVMAISGAIMPRLSIYYQSGNSKKFLKIILTLLFFVLIGGTIALIIVQSYGGEVLELLYTSDYKAYADEFLLFVGLAIVMYISKFLETGLTATRKFRVQPLINGITLIIVSVLSFLLIPTHGIFGIAYSLLIAEIIQVLIRGIVLGYFLKLRKNQ